jgi:hypothetical protein
MTPWSENTVIDTAAAPTAWDALTLGRHRILTDGGIRLAPHQETP